MKNFNKKLILNLLSSNGVDSDYLEDMDNCIESGSEEWMGILSELVGKDMYNEELNEDESKLVMEFIEYLENNLNIELI
jgi:hypothetical protein